MLVLVLGGYGSSLPLRARHGAYIDRRGAIYRQPYQDQDMGQGIVSRSSVARTHVIEHHQRPEVACDAARLWYQKFAWKRYTADSACKRLFKTLGSLKPKCIPIPAHAYAGAASLGRSRCNGTRLFTLHRADVALTLYVTGGRRARLRRVL